MQEASYAHDRCELEKDECRRRIIEIHLALLQLLDQIGGQCLGIHF